MPEKIEQKIEITIKVAKVIDEYTLVINKGSDDGIRNGQRFLIYTLGEEIIDPDTQKSLGKLEVVKGTGKVTHLQPAMATIASDMNKVPSKSVTRIKKRDPATGLAGFFGSSEVIEEETLPSETIPFENPEMNDIARPV